jgi:preprotein translocase subunit SecG
VVTSRIAKRGILSRRTLIVANAMVLISFALGYFLHPTW